MDKKSKWKNTKNAFKLFDEMLYKNMHVHKMVSTQSYMIYRNMYIHKIVSTKPRSQELVHIDIKIYYKFTKKYIHYGYQNVEEKKL